MFFDNTLLTISAYFMILADIMIKSLENKRAALTRTLANIQLLKTDETLKHLQLVIFQSDMNV